MFFEKLKEKQLLNEWTPILDWLLSNQRFGVEKGWDSNKKAQYTKKIKRIENVRPNQNWNVVSAKSARWKKHRNEKLWVDMTSDSSECVSFIRHIRNGIAHGECSVISEGGRTMIEIFDYKDDAHSKQTAYIWIPVEMVSTLYKLYDDTVKEGKTKKKVKNKTA